jgi:hypothetical protein
MDETIAVVLVVVIVWGIISSSFSIPPTPPDIPPLPPYTPPHVTPPKATPLSQDELTSIHYKLVALRKMRAKETDPMKQSKLDQEIYKQEQLYLQGQ